MKRCTEMEYVETVKDLPDSWAKFKSTYHQNRIWWVDPATGKTVAEALHRKNLTGRRDHSYYLAEN